MRALLSNACARSWLALLLVQLRLSSGSCPCRDPSLCTPISGSRDFEVFVFDVGGKTWKFYDWSQITTVATFGKYDPELMCYAHSKGSRVVLKGYISVKKIVEPAARAAWISQQVDLAKKQYMDGINIDIEQEVNKSSAEYFALTALVKETTDAFHKEIPGSQEVIKLRAQSQLVLEQASQKAYSVFSTGFVLYLAQPEVTFDVAWSPKCIDRRCYNYTGIADSCDFVFVMSYDEQSQVWTDCIARANAPYNQTLAGYDDYLRLGISPKKLVMGVPWYGYDYTCLNLSKVHTCSIKEISFRGAPCSDAAGRQVPYRNIMNRVNSSLSEILWNEEQKAPYLEYNDRQGAVHQIWFDDPRSISLKAAYVKERGLRGIGMWNGNCLDYSGGPVAQEQTKAMWEALKPK